jgi:branched-chain amino acid transport system permease protein
MSVYTEGLLIQMGINILMALSVYVILTTDQLSLGNAGFMAIGAYTSAYLTVKLGMPLPAAMVVAAIVSTAVGVVVGFPALRVRGIYLVMATLAFGEIVRTFFLIFEPTGGAYGFRGPAGTTLALTYVWVVGIFVLCWLMDRSRFGRALDAVRDDVDVAGAIGLNVTLLKVTMFGLGAFIAAIAGALYAHHMFYIESSNFNFLVSATAVLFVILGGMQTSFGPVVGAVIFSVLPEMLRFLGSWRLSFFGGLLVLLMIARPSGLITRRMVREFGRLPFRRREAT